MPFLKAVILSDIMQVVSANYNRTLHLHLSDHTSQYSSTDADIACERALLVNVCTFNSLQMSNWHKISSYNDYIYHIYCHNLHITKQYMGLL